MASQTRDFGGMTHDELESWLRAGVLRACNAYGGSGSGRDHMRNPFGFWWPTSQAAATTLAWAITLAAAHDLGLLNGPPVWFGAAWGSKNDKRRAADKAAKKAILTTLKEERSALHHSPHEVMVDFTLTRYASDGSPGEVLLAAESEMARNHGVGTQLGYRGADGYSWDFYKLLHFRSRTRLFLCRIGTSGEPGDARRDQLQQSLASVVPQYPKCLQPGDRLGCIILPATKSRSDDVRVGTLSDGKHLVWETTSWPSLSGIQDM